MRHPHLRDCIRWDMQPLILLLVFWLAADGDHRQTLQNFLCFYRENRDLFAHMLAMPADPPVQERAARRPEKDGARTVLELFLDGIG